MLPRPQKLCTV